MKSKINVIKASNKDQITNASNKSSKNTKLDTVSTNKNSLEKKIPKAKIEVKKEDKKQMNSNSNSPKIKSSSKSPSSKGKTSAKKIINIVQAKKKESPQLFPIHFENIKKYENYLNNSCFLNQNDWKDLSYKNLEFSTGSKDMNLSQDNSLEIHHYYHYLPKRILFKNNFNNVDFPRASFFRIDDQNLRQLRSDSLREYHRNFESRKSKNKYRINGFLNYNNFPKQESLQHSFPSIEKADGNLDLALQDLNLLSRIRIGQPVDFMKRDQIN